LQKSTSKKTIHIYFEIPEPANSAFEPDFSHTFTPF